MEQCLPKKIDEIFKNEQKIYEQLSDFFLIPHTKYKVIDFTPSNVEIMKISCFNQFETISKTRYIAPYALIAQNKLCVNFPKLAIFKPPKTLRKMITGKISF